jgi:valyl-tRNA synthetase
MSEYLKILNTYNTLYHDFLKSNVNKNYDFIILMPPPNVSGALHLGHALTYFTQDFFVRIYKFFKNKNSCLLPGLDHGGLSTEISCRNKNNCFSNLSREEQFKYIEKFAQECGETIKDQMKNFGLMTNNEYLKYTLDADHTKLVQDTFISLYNEGLIEKRFTIVNFDTTLKTTISDLETDTKEISSFLYKISYKIENSENFITVATTRPETIFADSAIAVNAQDDRYKHLIGKKALIPIINKSISIIEDNYVDMNFGTGALKVTPAHDGNDFHIGQRHNLPMISIIDIHGNLDLEALKDLESYKEIQYLNGKSVYEARDILGKQLSIEATNIIQKIPFNNKSNTAIQSLLQENWFLKMKDIAVKALSSMPTISPDNWKGVVNHWLNNINDWCISRSLIWGHKMPIWYKDNEYKISIDCPGDQWHSKNEVFDTWFSSALWPLSYKNSFNIYPSDILVTAYDIIFFWVARMIMISLKIDNTLPFSRVFIHRLVRDAEGQKMSKTKGNVVNPIEVIEKYGSDTLRLALMQTISPHANINFSDKILEKARNILTKLKNLNYFINNFVKKEALSECNSSEVLLIEEYYENYLFKIEQEIERNLETMDIHIIIKKIEDFLYEICDWLLEFYKVNKSLKNIFMKCYAKLLLLMNSIAPHYSTVYYYETFEISIWNTQYKYQESTQDLKNIIQVKNLKDVIEFIRSFKNLEINFNLEDNNFGSSFIKKLCLLKDTNDNIDNNIISKNVFFKTYNLKGNYESTKMLDNKKNKINEEIKNIEVFLLKCNKNTPKEVLEEKNNLLNTWKEELKILEILI